MPYIRVQQDEKAFTEYVELHSGDEEAAIYDLALFVHLGREFRIFGYGRGNSLMGEMLAMYRELALENMPTFEEDEEFISSIKTLINYVPGG